MHSYYVHEVWPLSEHACTKDVPRVFTVVLLISCADVAFEGGVVCSGI